MVIMNKISKENLVKVINNARKYLNKNKIDDNLVKKINDATTLLVSVDMNNITREVEEAYYFLLDIVGDSLDVLEENNSDDSFVGIDRLAESFLKDPNIKEEDNIFKIVKGALDTFRNPNSTDFDKNNAKMIMSYYLEVYYGCFDEEDKYRNRK